MVILFRSRISTMLLVTKGFITQQMTDLHFNLHLSQSTLNDCFLSKMSYLDMRKLVLNDSSCIGLMMRSIGLMQVMVFQIIWIIMILYLVSTPFSIVMLIITMPSSVDL